MSDLGGVWRTVGGRRIFIKDGEDLATAMKNSGKFGKKKENNKNNREEKIKKLEEELEETKGFLAKAKIKEEIEALKEGYDDIEEYRKMKDTKRQEAIENSKKEKEERQKLRQQQEQEEKERGYKMSHRPDENGSTGDDLTTGETPMPKDFYNNPEKYFDMSLKENKESFEVIKEIKGKPNAEITIYRATTSNEINDGDWITLSKTYAQIHNKSNLDNKGNIVSMKVKASEIRFAGDDLNEFGYFPKKKK